MNLSSSPEKAVKSPANGATVNEWLQWLEAIHPTEIDMGLDRVLVVLRRLFPKKPNARIITVAGTNGKGSTVATLERQLLAAGRTTGAYTSPHLQRYNERIRIDGNIISDAALVTAFEKVEEARGHVSLTYFEFGTLAAFVALEQAGVQDWVLEVGLGGRLDAVNVLDADFAIITSIDIDHIGFLGDNREVIGFEKAGILRPGITAVCADPVPPASVLQQATAQKVDLRLTGRDYRLEPRTYGCDIIELVMAEGRVALPAGPLPIESVAAATVMAAQLVPEAGLERLGEAAHSVNLPGRFERLSNTPLVIADVGHNPHAARWLASRLYELKQQNRGRVVAVYAALGDKDIEGVVSAMAPVVDHWCLAGLSVPRGLSVGELQARVGEVASVGSSATIAEALDDAKGMAVEPADCVVVFGSFFTVAEARELLLDDAP
ncbi:bifunctional tetrahydrofolate synthase/dihydrofolate synthase [Marinobacter litoralis]|uniref:bifunctional tetrahydrofolate synthase/dihydrofolate synthase n=1 Tax=Marinobacter litoralis TaxID=187981 RepID=UPI0018EAEAA0|nr:bifunctional tetrahydrofolate synthase/dihydrofolate synthase [Marinobacter litoralis]MBJ6137771.1 bifunctional tetrahydrofolate synthase/dihydrofolate synthase [Marinobacter litoralis]